MFHSDVRSLACAFTRRWSWLLTRSWANYKDYTYVGTLNPLFQLSVAATGTSLRPIADMFLEHILDPKPPNKYGVLRWFKTAFVVILALLIRFLIRSF